MSFSIHKLNLRITKSTHDQNMEKHIKENYSYFHYIVIIVDYLSKIEEIMTRESGNRRSDASMGDGPSQQLAPPPTLVVDHPAFYMLMLAAAEQLVFARRLIGIRKKKKTVKKSIKIGPKIYKYVQPCRLNKIGSRPIYML